MVWRVRVFVGVLLVLAAADRLEPGWASWIRLAAVGTYLVVIVPGTTHHRKRGR